MRGWIFTGLICIVIGVGAALAQRISDWDWFGLFLRHGAVTEVDADALARAVVAALPPGPRAEEIAAAVVSRLPTPPTETRPTPAPREERERPVARTGGSCPDPDVVRRDPSMVETCLEEWREREAQARSAVRFLNGVSRAYKHERGRSRSY